MKNIFRQDKLLMLIMFLACFGLAVACTDSGGSSDAGNSSGSSSGIEVAESTFNESTFNDTVFE